MLDALSENYRNRLRILSERDRFYRAGSSTLNSLARHELIIRTGSHDRFGREEWTLTDAGRKLLRMADAGASV